MKKILIATLGLLVAVTTTQAQSEYTSEKQDIKKDKQEETEIKKEKKEERKELRRQENKEVSYQSQQQFFEDFGDVPNVAWERTAAFDEASFTKDGEEMTAFYDLKAELVGTTTTKTFADIPVSAQHYIQKKYQGYDVKHVCLFDDNEDNATDMMLFGQQFEDADNYFVEVQKDNKRIILQVSMDGEVGYFTEMK